MKLAVPKMSFHPHELQEHSSRSLNRPDVFAPIAANSWNQNDMRVLNKNIESSLPAAFGSFDLIAQAPTIEATMPTFITPNTDVKPVSVVRGNDGFELADYGNDVRQGYQNVRHGALPTDIPRVVMPGLGDAAVHHFEHPFRGGEDQELGQIPATSWQTAYSVFANEFQKGDISEQQTTELNKALIRNELHNFNWTDNGDDILAQRLGSTISLPHRPADRATLGDAQISPKGLRDQRHEFKALDDYLTQHGYPPGTEVEALENRDLAPLFVAANMAHNVRQYRNHGIKPTEENLAYGFNPSKDEHGKPIILPTTETLSGSRHVKNVMNELQIIRENQH